MFCQQKAGPEAQVSPRSSGSMASETSDLRGNAALGEDAANAPRGPFGQGWLNQALTLAFGDLGGISADGDLGDWAAEGATEGATMAFDASIDADPSDPAHLEVIAHETAHALAGANGKGVDAPGDPGEAAADATGRRFRQWAESGFAGPAPKLAAARGGRAAVHRHGGGAALTGSPLLRQGSKGPLVETLQSLLNAKGADLAVDGDFGPITAAAVRSYQASHGLVADGIVGPLTAASLNSSSAPATSAGGLTGNPMLRIGSSGSLVSTLQSLLNSQGASLAVDGDFGPITDGAVRAFQAANGLAVDGVVGPITAGRLNDPGATNIGGGAAPAPAPTSGGSSSDTWRNLVLSKAASHLGAPYYWGGDGPTMFDCSGFVLYVLRQDTGLINWGDMTAGGIKNMLPATTTPKKGDPVFYSGSSGVQHVEIHTGNGTQEIGASGGGSSTFGNDPSAKVQYGDQTADSRSRSYGSIEGLIQAKL